MESIIHVMRRHRAAQAWLPHAPPAPTQAADEAAELAGKLGELHAVWSMERTGWAPPGGRTWVPRRTLDWIIMLSAC